MTTARELTNRLADLLAKEHGAMADFLVAVADFDQRRLWSDLGYAGLFDFLHRELGLSKGAAHFRKVAAQLVRTFPEIVEPLRDGRLCLSSVLELAKVLTPENRDQVLPRFFHRSRREAMDVVAELRPVERPPVRDVVTAARNVGLPAPARVVPAEPVNIQESGSPVLLAELAHANSRPSPQERRDAVKPLTADTRRFHVTVSRRFLAKLDAARDALSHSHPGATNEEILEAGLDLLERHGADFMVHQDRLAAEAMVLPATSVNSASVGASNPIQSYRIQLPEVVVIATSLMPLLSAAAG